MPVRPFKTNGRPIPRYRGKPSRPLLIPSVKNSAWRTFEGRGEAALGLEAEFDPRVVKYETQVRETYKVDGTRRKGWTDLVKTLVGQCVERNEVVLDHRLKDPHVLKRLAGKKAAAEARGETFHHVPHSAALKEPEYSNRLFLLRGRGYAIPDGALSTLREFLFQCPGRTAKVGDAVRALRERGFAAEVVYAAMAQRFVGFHIDVPIGESASVWWVG
jgi:hypothetical protein